MSHEPQINEAKSRMTKSLEAFQAELARQRTGRASLGVLDDVRVDYYGQMVPLNQVATLGVPEPKLITVAPWEAKIIPDIEKAIIKANLGLSPINDGKMIRLPIPPLTTERRGDLIKVIHKHAEEARVSIRHVRREIMDVFKKMEKEGKMPEDEVKKAENSIQKLTDEFVAKVDEAMGRKEKELLSV